MKAQKRVADRKSKNEGRKERTSEMLASPEPAKKKQKMQWVDVLEGQEKLKACESIRNKMMQDLSFLQQVQLCHKVAQLQLSLQEARKLDLVAWAHARTSTETNTVLRFLCSKLLQQWRQKVEKIWQFRDPLSPVCKSHLIVSKSRFQV